MDNTAVAVFIQVGYLQNSGDGGCMTTTCPKWQHGSNQPHRQALSISRWEMYSYGLCVSIDGWMINCYKTNDSVLFILLTRHGILVNWCQEITVMHELEWRFRWGQYLFGLVLHKTLPLMTMKLLQPDDEVQGSSHSNTLLTYSRETAVLVNSRRHCLEKWSSAISTNSHSLSL